MPTPNGHRWVIRDVAGIPYLSNECHVLFAQICGKPDQKLVDRLLFTNHLLWAAKVLEAYMEYNNDGPDAPPLNLDGWDKPADEHPVVRAQQLLAMLKEAFGDKEKPADDPVDALKKELAETRQVARDMAAALKATAFIVESVAHLQGHEREMLPVVDRARELIDRAERERFACLVKNHKEEGQT